MGPKIAHCETPKIIFRKSLNSEPTSDIEISWNKGRFFIETKSI